MWEIVIPNSMLELGAWLLLISIPMQLLTPQNSKIAIWFAFIGGFGVGGGVGGWFGSFLYSSTNAIATTTERFTAQAVGSGFGALVFVIIGVFMWRFAGKSGGGLQSKGKSKVAKVKQCLWLVAFAVLGTAIAGLPELYGLVNTGVSAASNALTAALP